MSGSIRVVVVDDDVPTRIGLRAIFAPEPDIDVVGEATSGTEACLLVESDGARVLLDPDGHYSGLLEWVRGLGERGFVRPEAIDRLVVATDVSEALDACAKPVGS